MSAIVLTQRYLLRITSDMPYQSETSCFFSSGGCGILSWMFLAKTKVSAAIGTKQAGSTQRKKFISSNLPRRGITTTKTELRRWDIFTG